MADTKVTGLGANTAPIATDLLYMVDDPGGTPASQKVPTFLLACVVPFPFGLFPIVVIHPQQP